MQAGRELDALIAEKVMGWKARHREDKCNGTQIIKCGACGRFGHANCYGQFGGGEIQSLCVDAPCCEAACMPEYSTSIAEAWLVVEKLRKTHCCLTLRSDFDYLWECYAIKDPDDLEHKSEVIVNYKIYAMSEVSAPHAICLAALQAVGWKESQP